MAVEAVDNLQMGIGAEGRFRWTDSLACSFVAVSRAAEKRTEDIEGIHVAVLSMVVVLLAVVVVLVAVVLPVVLVAACCRSVPMNTEN